jgi:hypothetical protein
MLFAGKLTQKLSHDLRALVCLLLDLAFADRVERPEEPHFLQVADERLQVFCGFDLWREKDESESGNECCQEVQEIGDSPSAMSPPASGIVDWQSCCDRFW